MLWNRCIRELVAYNTPWRTKAREYDDIRDGLRVEAALFRANKTYENAKCTELCKEGDVLVHLGRWELLNLRSGEHVDPQRAS